MHNYLSTSEQLPGVRMFHVILEIFYIPESEISPIIFAIYHTFVWQNVKVTRKQQALLVYANRVKSVTNMEISNLWVTLEVDILAL